MFRFHVNFEGCKYISPINPSWDRTKVKLSAPEGVMAAYQGITHLETTFLLVVQLRVVFFEEGVFLLTFYYLTMVDVGDAFCYVSIVVNLTIFKKTVFDCRSNDLEQIQVKPKIPRCKSSFCEDRIQQPNVQ